MRHTSTLILFVLLLSACGGGGSGAPQAIPKTTVSGAVVDGLIFNGTVSAYDFSTGKKGALFGEATTNSITGLYSMTIQVESRPLLLELTGGYYNEEMAPSAQVQLDASDKLYALVNFTTGEPITTSVTTYTTLAAGLAANQIASGVPVATAINNANDRVSVLIGANVTKTIPREITNAANASASLTPELQYGFLSGGISMWAYNNPPSLALRLVKPYVSIKLVQLMYQDVVADGFLDGVGKDAGGVAMNLSFGTKLLGVDVYRTGFASSVLKIADNVNNKTGLNSSKVLSFAQAYSVNTDPMWAGVPPVQVSTPTVALLTPTANQWVNSTVIVSATASDYSGLYSAELLVDGNSTATTFTGLATPAFTFSTSLLTEGTHNIGVRATNVLSLSTDATVPFGVDRTLPVVDISTITSNPSTCTITGTASDALSGLVGTVNVALCGFCSICLSSSAAINGGAWAVEINKPGACIKSGPNTITATLEDVAGNAGTHQRDTTWVPAGTVGCGGL